MRSKTEIQGQSNLSDTMFSAGLLIWGSRRLPALSRMSAAVYRSSGVAAFLTGSSAIPRELQDLKTPVVGKGHVIGARQVPAFATAYTG